MNWRLSPSLRPIWTKRPASSLERGQRVTELMKQAQYSPLSVAEMAVTLYAVDNGFMDEVPVDKVRRFERALHAT